MFTQGVKWVMGVTESKIGLHKSDGKLLKARYATIVYALVILTSNIVAFLSYEWSITQATAYVDNILVIDIVLVFACTLVIWGYLKAHHYSRE